MNYPNQWLQENVDVFWGEIAPCDHVIQIYEDDSIFLDALAGFVGGGIKAEECVVVIGTQSHLSALNKRLSDYGILVDVLEGDERYIPLDAEETLSKFMINGWPDETLFYETIDAVIQRGSSKKRKIRAFGEMVAILWAQGLSGATVQLEHLWNKFCNEHRLSLFCAYPRSGFTQNMNESLLDICGCHSKIIDGARNQLMEVAYSEIQHKKAI
jgi:hypothetical protein